MPGCSGQSRVSLVLGESVLGQSAGQAWETQGPTRAGSRRLVAYVAIDWSVCLCVCGGM